jgi:uncharacterized membrane protein
MTAVREAEMTDDSRTTAAQPAGSDTSAPRSTTGLDENLAATLTYLLGFITGIVFLVIEKDSPFVRFHAMQSTIVFAGLWVVSIVMLQVPFIGWLIYVLLVPITFILWLVLMFKAYQKEKFKLPIVGNIAEEKA